MSDRPKLVHDEAKLRDALKRLVNGAWRGGQAERAEPCFSIPASYDRDADLILAVAIDELVRLRPLVEAANEVLKYADQDVGRFGIEVPADIAWKFAHAVRHAEGTMELHENCDHCRRGKDGGQ